jgi:hypothetical protein
MGTGRKGRGGGGDENVIPLVEGEVAVLVAVEVLERDDVHHIVHVANLPWRSESAVR